MHCQPNLLDNNGESANTEICVCRYISWAFFPKETIFVVCAPLALEKISY